MIHWLAFLRQRIVHFFRAAPVTSGLLLVNTLVHLLVTLGSEPASVLAYWGLTPLTLTQSSSVQGLLTVFTSMFLHGGAIHLLLNMVMLAVFGKLLESQVSRSRYLVIYLLSGVVGAIAHVLLYPMSVVPMVGASGALSGVLGAAVVLRPRVRLWVVTPFTLFLPVPMRMRTLGTLWAIVQLAGLVFGDLVDGGIAYAAHLGGYVAGLYLIRTLGSRSHTKQPRYRMPRSEVGFGPAPSESFRTYFVTDSRGRTFTFHSPKA